MALVSCARGRGQAASPGKINIFRDAGRIAGATADVAIKWRDFQSSGEGIGSGRARPLLSVSLPRTTRGRSPAIVMLSTSVIARMRRRRAARAGPGELYIDLLGHISII
jgi:hypothetical protein